MQANSLADLRARRAALNARLARGQDCLRQREESGDTTSPEYQRLQSAWLGLLAEHEIICSQIAAHRGQVGKPAPTPAPAPPAVWQDKPAQLVLFAPASSYSRGMVKYRVTAKNGL
jgi:hypothetical protein